MKSNAPSFVARTAVSMFPCPEIITTMGASSCDWMRSSASSPSIFGSHTSIKIKSKRRCSSRARHSSPEAADLRVVAFVAQKRAERFADPAFVVDNEYGGWHVSARCGMLSQENPSERRPFLFDIRRNYAAGLPACCIVATSTAGKRITNFEPVGKLSSTRIAAVVFRDDAAGNCEAESGSAVLGRKVRQKQPLFILRRNTVTAVGNFDYDSVVVAFGARGHRQLLESPSLPSLRRRYRSSSRSRGAAARGRL